MKRMLFAALVIFTSCSTSQDLTVTPAVMRVKNGHISFVKTGSAILLSDSLDGKPAFIISKSIGPSRLTRF
ncbi:hypothetical protein BH11BAC5_BH11BAC5_18010 [soil metagenome]